jgi:hypothetical protein
VIARAAALTRKNSTAITARNPKKKSPKRKTRKMRAQKRSLPLKTKEKEPARLDSCEQEAQIAKTARTKNATKWSSPPKTRGWKNSKAPSN